jgi:hypothetical protein
MTRCRILSSGVTGKMVFEQMLTILLGTGIGVAAVLYAVKPRHVGASQSFGISTIETFAPSPAAIDSENSVAPMPEVTATQPPIVEAPVEEAHVMTSPVVPTMTAEISTAGSSPAASIASIIDASAVSSPAVSATTVESSTAPAAGTNKVSTRRRSAASSRTHAKSSASGPRTRKRVE